MERNCLQWSEDSPTLLSEQKPGFSDAGFNKDNLYVALFQIQNDELDQLTQNCHGLLLSYSRKTNGISS